MTRKIGSGLSSATSEAIEHILIGTALDDVDNLEHGTSLLEKQIDKGRCAMSVASIHHIANAVIAALPFDPVSAVRQPESALGDIEFTDQNGELWWLELKAQTTKNARDFLQADYVRDATGAVHVLANHVSALEERLAQHDVTPRAGALSEFPYFWMCDVLLLPTYGHRAGAKVSNMATLADYAKKKFLLHVARDQSRFFCFRDIPMVDRGLTGKCEWIHVPAGKSERIYVSTTDSPRQRHFEFVYYVGFRNALGRHKLHPRVLDEALPIWCE